MKVGIVGATGYTGEELLYLISRHPGVELGFATSESKPGIRLGDLFPGLSHYSETELIRVQDSFEIDVDAVFFCLPAGKSAPLAKKFLLQNAKIIDLGADFRFKSARTYKTWYQQDHPAPELLEQSEYGLPELNRKAISTASIIGNPGCYPTSVLLGLYPFLKQEVLEEVPIIVDSKSGVTGAGKAPSDTTHFIAVHDSIVAYKPGRVHRHVGEMETHAGAQLEKETKIIFTPHLVPMARGISSSIYIQVKTSMNKSDVDQLLRDTYADESFVKVLTDRIPSTKMTVPSNLCFVHAEPVTGTNQIVIISTIDNLGKGASWQAIQNMNLILGFDETLGLISS